MYIPSPLDSASRWLSASNVVYVAGAVLTFAAAIHVLIEKRAVLAGNRPQESFWAEASVVIAAAVSVLGTIGAIYFGYTVSHLKDVELDTYKASVGAYEKGADLKIAQLQSQTAADKRGLADADVKNSQLKIELATHEEHEKLTDAQLAAQNKETSNFAHALAVQQANMSEEAKVAPILSPSQTDDLARLLRAYRGQIVILHSTADTTVLRLKQTIYEALERDGMTAPQENMTDFGALYKGVSVVVHSPTDVPPLANALVVGLRRAGIAVQTVSASVVPAGRVAIYLGPN